MLEAYEKWTVRDMPQVDYAQEEAYYEDERAQSNHYLGMAVLLAGVGVAGYFVYQHYLAPKASGTTTTVKRTAPTPTHKPKKTTAPVKTTSHAATGPKAPSPSQIKFTLSQCTLLQYGSQGQAVKMLQEAIWSLGFNPLGIDGIFGPNTEAAVKRFQAAMHISVDGIAGPQTYGALNRALASHGGYWKCRTASYYSGTSSTRATGSVSSLPLLEVGSTGTLVRKVQQALIYLGYNPKTNLDGIFGSITRASVVKFQSYIRAQGNIIPGMLVDGIVGPQTYTALNYELKKRKINMSF